MPEASIVVQAKWSAAAGCDHEVCAKTDLLQPIYGVKEGEQGLLTLRISRAGTLYDRTTYVLWDDDPDQQPRKVQFDEVSVVGIEIEGQRLVSHSRS